MKKVIIIASVVILLAVLAVGLIHATTLHLPAPLRIWQKDDLAEAAGIESFEEFTNWMDIDDHESYGGDRYYGEYNGYYIISQQNQTGIIMTATLGEYRFVLKGRDLLAYKDGVGMELFRAYKQGYIQDKDVKKIYKYHMQIEDYRDNDQGIVNSPAPISLELRDQLDADYAKINEDYIPLWYGEDDLYDQSRIYGEDNGYILFFDCGGMRMQAHTTKMIGGVEFFYPTSFGFYAYKDGEFIEAEEAYEQGLISYEALVKAQEYHLQIEGPPIQD